MCAKKLKTKLHARLTRASKGEQRRVMDEQSIEANESASNDTDIKNLVRGAIQEFFKLEQSKAEPAYKTELLEERKRREQLERRLNELVEENRRSRMVAEELERNSAIKSELQRLGVAKIDL